MTEQFRALVTVFGARGRTGTASAWRTAVRAGGHRAQASWWHHRRRHGRAAAAMMVRASAHRGRRGAAGAGGVRATAEPRLAVRHGALMLALAGLPFFIIALADPRTALTRSKTIVPGPPHQPADRRLVQHAVGAAVDDARQGRAEQRRVLHHGRRGPLFHRAPHGGQVPRPDGARSSSATMPTSSRRSRPTTRTSCSARR